MRYLRSLILAMSVVVAAPSLADHAVNNAAETARAAYRAADAAEALAGVAFREAGWDVQRDHRPETLRQLAGDANSLHFSLSDLYRAALRASGGWGPRDHAGDGIRGAFERVRGDFYQLGQSYHELRPYTLSPELHRLYRSVYDTYSRLEWLVLGVGAPI